MPITPTTRTAKGSELTWAELDANFTSIAAAVNFLMPADVAFSASVPFTGNLFMPQQSVSSVIGFSINFTGATKGSHVYVRLVADGTNAPTFTGFKEWGGSMGYDNRAGIVNEVEFFFDGNDYWYSISQAVGAVAIDAVAPTFSSAQVTNAARSVIAVTMSEAINGASVPPTTAWAVSGGKTVTNVAISGAVVSLTVNSAYAYGNSITVQYTPGTPALQDMAGNSTVAFGPSSVANNIATVPGAPTIGTATAGNAQATVGFTAPASNGGAAITGYTATSSPGGFTASGAASPLTVTGLTNGTAYTFTVTANNSEGTGAASAASNSATPAAVTVPGAPTALTLGTATSTTQPLTWTAPASNGGSAITDYVVQWSPAGANTWTTFADGTSTTAGATITGLTASTSYDYRVAAVNAIGQGSYSSTSTGSTAAGSAAYLRLTTTTALTESGTGPYSYIGSSASTGYGAAGYGIGNLTLASGADGWFSTGQSGASTEQPIILLRTNGTNALYSDSANVCGIFLNGTTYTQLTNGAGGSLNGSGVGSTSDRYRLRRSGSTVTAERSTDGGATWPTVIHTWSGITTGQLWCSVNATKIVAAANLNHSGLT